MLNERISKAFKTTMPKKVAKNVLIYLVVNK